MYMHMYICVCVRESEKERGKCVRENVRRLACFPDENQLWTDPEAGSYLRLTDLCITQL